MSVHGSSSQWIAVVGAGLLALSLGAGGASSAETNSSSRLAHDQLAAGEAAYQRSCALCHGADLNGPNAPALTGPDILTAYNTVGGLQDYIAVSMPPQAPGKLQREDYAAIVAYVLSANGACVGDHPLLSEPSDSLLNLTALAGKCSQAAEPASGLAATRKIPQAYTWGKKLPSVTDLP